MEVEGTDGVWGKVLALSITTTSYFFHHRILSFPFISLFLPSNCLAIMKPTTTPENHLEIQKVGSWSVISHQRRYCEDDTNTTTILC